MKLYDKKGNVYTVIGSAPGNMLDLKGEDGIVLKISIADMGTTYTAYPPEIFEAAKKVLEALASGEIKKDDLKNLKNNKEAL